MEATAQRIGKHSEEVEEVDNGGHGSFLGLPKLGHQQSLQDLIEDDLQSRDDGSIEMSTLLLRTDGNADSDSATIAAPSSRPPDEVPGPEYRKLFKDENNSRSPDATGSKCTEKPSHQNFWRRLIRRYHYPTQADGSLRLTPTLRRNTHEQPKVIYSHQRRGVLAEILTLHLIPVSINFALLGLYIRQVLWAPPWPTTNVLNSLQFASKVHETLMIVSLSKILLHHVRYRLLSSTDQGLSLGLVTSPFRLLDLTYLWSQEFSAAWWGKRRISSSDVISIFAHIYLFILAAVLGPASAISMLPRLGEWKIATAIANAPFYSANLTQIYMGGQVSDLYQQRITAAFIPKACDYSNLSQPQSNDCPRYGLEDILKSWLPSRFANESSDFSLTLMGSNITVQGNVNTEFTPRTIFVPWAHRLHFAENVQSVVDATTASDAVLRFARSLYQYYFVVKPWQLGTDAYPWPTYIAPATFRLYPGRSQGRHSPSSWKQPYVSTLCSQQRRILNSSGPLSFAFNANHSIPWPTEIDRPDYIVELDSSLLPKLFKSTEMGFLDLSHLKIQPQFPLSAAFIYTDQSNMALCLVKAAWVDMALSLVYERIFEDLRISWTWQLPPSYHDSLAHNEEAWFDESNSTDIIMLDLEWLEILDFGTTRDRKSDHSFFKRFSQTCRDNSAVDWYGAPTHGERNIGLTCMTSGLAVGIAEGLSKVANHYDIHAVGSVDFLGRHYGPSMTLSPWSDVKVKPKPDPAIEYLYDANWTTSTLSPREIEETGTRLDFEITERVYGYGFRDVTVTMAFVVLFVYVATVFIHVTITSFGTSWSSRAWTSLGEYFVLAMQSPAPTSSVLSNTGGGVKKHSTWKARVSVLEMQGGKKVGFTIRDSGRSDAEDASKQVTKVRPDWEYS